MKNNNVKHDEGVTLNLLSAIDSNKSLTQRVLSKELGIALGLTNRYLKRCIDKGLVKFKSIPANRYSYYLTPSGFSEKTKLTAKYFYKSFNFYREAKDQCLVLINECLIKKKKRLILSDPSEFAEIAIIVSHNTNLDFIGILGDNGESYLSGISMKKSIKDFNNYDAVLISKMEDVQNRYSDLLKVVPKNKIIFPEILKNIRG